MKIEVELSELVELRNQVERLKLTEKELTEKIATLNESELIKKSVSLSHRLFDEYMRCVFRKLGFTAEYQGGCAVIAGHAVRVLGKDWYDRDDSLNVEITAEVSNEFRKAILSIGVITEPQKKESDYQL